MDTHNGYAQTYLNDVNAIIPGFKLAQTINNRALVTIFQQNQVIKIANVMKEFSITATSLVFCHTGANPVVILVVQQKRYVPVTEFVASEEDCANLVVGVVATTPMTEHALQANGDVFAPLLNVGGVK